MMNMHNRERNPISFFRQLMMISHAVCLVFSKNLSGKMEAEEKSPSNDWNRRVYFIKNIAGAQIGSNNVSPIFVKIIE